MAAPLREAPRATLRVRFVAVGLVAGGGGLDGVGVGVEEWGGWVWVSIGVGVGVGVELDVVSKVRFEDEVSIAGNAVLKRSRRLMV